MATRKDKKAKTTEQDHPPVRTKHYLDKELMRADHPVNVLLVGCGATGSAFARHLARLQVVLESVNMFMNVTVADMDTIEPHNIGKQAYSPVHIHENKAIALSLQVNRYYGSQWEAKPYQVTKQMHIQYDIIISATDTLSSRKIIKDFNYIYWLDMGNLQYHGQAILASKKHKLKNIFELFPGIKQSKNVPSCSMEESLSKQSLFINDHIATYGAQILFDLLYHKNLDYAGYYFSLINNSLTQIPILK